MSVIVCFLGPACSVCGSHLPYFDANHNFERALFRLSFPYGQSLQPELHIVENGILAIATGEYLFFQTVDCWWAAMRCRCHRFVQEQFDVFYIVIENLLTDCT